MSKIVGFTIKIEGQKEVTDLTKVFNVLQTQLLIVNQTMIELNKNTKGVASSFDGAKGILKDSMKSFQDTSKAAKDLGNGYIEVVEAVEATGKSISDLKKENKDLKKILEEAPKEGEKGYEELSAELDKAREQFAKNREEIVKFNKELRTGKKESDIQGGSILDLRNKVKDLTKEYNALSPAQRKATEGKEIQKSLARTVKELKKLEEAVGDNRRSVGDYGRALDKVGRASLKVFGIRGILEGIRNIGRGLLEIINNADGTDKALSGIQGAVSGLSSTAQNLGKNLLSTFGGTIQKVIENVSFVLFKVGEAFTSAANSGGFFGTILSGIGSFFADFPAIIGGVAEVFGEFRDRIVNTATEASLTVEKLILNVKRLGTAITGGDTAAIDARLQQVNKSLQDNVIAARSISQAYTDGFDATKQAQEEFNNATAESVKLQQQQEEQAKKSEEAAKKRAAEEKRKAEEDKRAAEQLVKDQNKLLEDLQNESLARLKIVADLSNQLIDAEIANNQNKVEALIQQENERFRREKEARANNLSELEKELQERRAEVIRLFGEESQELKDFEAKTGKEISDIKETNRKLDEQKEKEHQANITKIQKDAAEARKKALEQAFNATRDAITKGVGILSKKIKEATDSANKNQDNLKKKSQEISQAIQDITNSVFSGISSILEATSNAEVQRLEDLKLQRQENIDDLNEELQNATGLQKKFLERRLKEEQAAQEELTKKQQEEEKKRAKAAQVLALIQAAINGAIAITRAFSDLGPIAGAVAAVGVAAAIAAQIATIASQKFAKGGVIDGPSHAKGGVPILGGRAEVEGGEAIINKRSTVMFKPLLSAINQAGGGNKFADGGILGSSLTPVAVGNTNLSKEIDRLIQSQQQSTVQIAQKINSVKVAVPVLDVQQVIDTDNNLNTQATF